LREHRRGDGGGDLEREEPACKAHIRRSLRSAAISAPVS
jgi:hypothetical protein